MMTSYESCIVNVVFLCFLILSSLQETDLFFCNYSIIIVSYEIVFTQEMMVI